MVGQRARKSASPNRSMHQGRRPARSAEKAAARVLAPKIRREVADAKVRSHCARVVVVRSAEYTLASAARPEGHDITSARKRLPPTRSVSEGALAYASGW